jgi:nitrite reductase/ring-hydroxylating ferredoxin subunit
MTGWIKIAASRNELFQSTLPVHIVNGLHICFAEHKGVLYAFQDKCPHAGGKMSAGFVDALGNIVCPLHRYRFSLSRGYNVSGEGYYLKTYPVKEEDGIWVQC